MDQDKFGVWAETAPSLNAGNIKTPLLIETPESEYALVLELFGSINRHGGTVDMYVFPEEGHWLGRSPAHGYWRALRALAWFRFWLKGDGYLGPELAREQVAWRKLRAERLGRQVQAQ